MIRILSDTGHATLVMLAGNGSSSPYDCYMRERIVLEIRPSYSALKAFLPWTVNGVTYYSDADGMLNIDITELVKSATGATYPVLVTSKPYRAGYVTMRTGFEFELTRLNSFNPKGILMPEPETAEVQQVLIADTLQDIEEHELNLQVLTPVTDRSGVNIAPPNVMLFSNYQPRPIAELWGVLEQARYDYNGETLEVFEHQLDFDDIWAEGSGELRAINAFPVLSWQVQLADLCERTCCLRWLSDRGIRKQHIFRVRAQKNTATSRAILPTFNGYIDERGKEVEFTAYIEGLTDYGVAYYADIVNSPEVYCTFESEFMELNDEVLHESQRVEIATKEVNIPDTASKSNTIAVTVRYKHYDFV